MLGDWDAAERELTHAADADGLAEVEYLIQCRGSLAGLRGDTQTADAMLAALPDTMRTSQNPVNRASVAIVEGFTAAARHRPHETLRYARAVLAHADVLGLSAEDVRWAWPLAARAAYDLGDTAATRDLLAQLDSCKPEQLAPMLRAERDLVRARLAADQGDPAAAELLTAAITGLRQHSTPYHLAHGLLDHAEHLTAQQDSGAATIAVDEAREIAERLRCRPLLDRADTLQAARSRAPA